jgi:hypothetical protein
MRGSRTLAMALLVGLGVTCVAAAAAAVESGGSSDVGTASTAPTVSDSTTSTSAPTTSTVPTSTLVPNAAVTTVPPKGNVERSTDGCDGQSYANHGQFVSSVAHDPSSTGDDISKAAQSACGKPVIATQDAEASHTETTEGPEATEAPEQDGSHGTGHGNHGNGNK